MKSFNICIFFSLLLYELVTSLNAVSFTLQFFYDNNLNPTLSKLNNIYNINVYSTIKIGHPELLIKTLFSIENRYYSIYPKLELNDDPGLPNYYNISKSDTFQNISSLNKYYVCSQNDIAAKEKFIFNMYNLINKTNFEIILNDLDFILGVRNHNFDTRNKTDIYYLNIGLDMTSSQTEKYNFINLLKEREIIDNYNWFISYEKLNRNKDIIYNLDDILQTKPKLIMGCLPHDYYPKLFSKNNIISDYSFNLRFKEIYYYFNHTKYNAGLKRRELPKSYNEYQIDFNEFVIIAPILYRMMILDDFFSKYISQDLCHYYYDSLIEGFYCDKSEDFNINNLKEFPTLYFEHSKLNYTFEFDYQDLFIEKDGKYWFLIVVENGDVNDWILGYVFLSKYQFAFNQDAKSISFYNQQLIDDEEEENNYNKNEKQDEQQLTNNIHIIILIIISWIIFIILGYLLGKYLCTKYISKKRANELEDEYEYVSENNDNIN